MIAIWPVHASGEDEGEYGAHKSEPDKCDLPGATLECRMDYKWARFVAAPRADRMEREV